MKSNLIKQKILYSIRRRLHDVHARQGLVFAIRNKKIEKGSLLRLDDDGGQVHGGNVLSIRSGHLNTITDKSEWQSYKDEFPVNDSLGG